MAYRCYAEFFDREFKEGVRPFPTESGLMGAFGEARYLAGKSLTPRSAFRLKAPGSVPTRSSAHSSVRRLSRAAP